MPVDNFTDNNGTGIKGREIRSEANKTSWVSPNYPTAGRHLDMSPSWLESGNVDTNSQLSLSGPNVNMYNQFNGWDTWKKPTIHWVGALQYDSDKGLIVGFRVSGGDVYRSVFGVSIFTGGYGGSGSSLYSSKLFRFAPEYEGSGYSNTLEANNKKFSNLDELFQASNSGPFYDIKAVGGLTRYDDYQGSPVGAELVTPDSTKYPDLIFAACFPNAPAGNTYYPRVRLGDGRIDDTLASQRSANTFSVETQPSPSWQGWTNADYSNTPPALANTDAVSGGSGSIEVFSGYGNIIVGDTSYDEIEVKTENDYIYFFNTDNKYWVYYYKKPVRQALNVPVGSNNKGRLVFPDSDQSFYHGQGDDDYKWPYEGLWDTGETFQNDYQAGGYEQYRWKLFQNTPLPLTGLPENSDYDIYLMPYREGDSNRKVNSQSVDAPFDDNRKVIRLQASTDVQPSAQLGIPTITNVSISNSLAQVSFNYTGDTPDDIKVEFTINEAFSTSASTYTVMTDITYQSGSFSFNNDGQLFLGNETIRVRMTVERSGYQDGGPSGVVSN